MFTREETTRLASSHRGRVITFYSYKGGVGRSMALANVAALLALWKRRVLVLDWDLEAPGLEKFFESDSSAGRGSRLAELRTRTPGIVDMIRGLAQGQPIAWRDCLIGTDFSSNGGELSLISAGRDDPEYAARVRAIDWDAMFAEHDFDDYLELLRKEWIAEYDFVLVDSRTGVTDVGGVCSIYLPDIVIAMFTANQQSVEGVKRVLSSLRVAHEQLALDRFRLQLVPLPGRDESVTEHEKSQEWREIFATELAEFYQSWLPSGSSPRRVLERLKIPYKPYWSFGERLPAVLEGTTDPTSVGYAYATVANLIIEDLDWQSVSADGERVPPLVGANVAPRSTPRGALPSPTVSAAAPAPDNGPRAAPDNGPRAAPDNGPRAAYGRTTSDRDAYPAEAPLAAGEKPKRRKLLVATAALAATGLCWLIAQTLVTRAEDASPATIILSSSPAIEPSPPATLVPPTTPRQPSAAQTRPPVDVSGTPSGLAPPSTPTDKEATPTSVGTGVASPVATPRTQSKQQSTRPVSPRNTTAASRPPNPKSSDMDVFLERR